MPPVYVVVSLPPLRSATVDASAGASVRLRFLSDPVAGCRGVVFARSIDRALVECLPFRLSLRSSLFLSPPSSLMLAIVCDCVSSSWLGQRGLVELARCFVARLERGCVNSTKEVMPTVMCPTPWRFRHSPSPEMVVQVPGDSAYQ